MYGRYWKTRNFWIFSCKIQKNKFASTNTSNQNYVRERKMAEVKSLLKGNLRYVAKILPITLLNILLPTIDIVSDVYMIVKLYVGVYECKWTSTEKIDDYWSCRNDSHNFCSNSNTANDNICISITHPIYATVLFLPFFVTYSVCFYSWSQSVKEKSSNFLYPLLGIYPQFGK